MMATGNSGPDPGGREDRMKILIISQHFWPESFRINEVVGSLRAAGCEVSVLTGQPNYPEGDVFDGYCAWGAGSECHPSGYTVYRVPVYPRGQRSSLGLVANYLSFVGSAALVAPWLLRGQRFDLIFVYGTSPILQAVPAIVLKHVKRAKLVTWVQDLWPESLEATGHVRDPRLLRGVAAVVRWIYRRNDLLLAQSKAFLPIVRAMAGPIPVEYHPNPGESAFAVRASQDLPALVLEPGFNVVFAGNLGTVQALDTVLDAAQQLLAFPDVRFVLLGSGSRSKWLHGEIARRALGNVKLPGRFPTGTMPGILSQASALLVSLVRSPIMSLTVPSKVQAYLAAGRPVIASMEGAGAQVVEEAGAGIACPAEDAAALVAAVLRLRAETPEQLARMGQAGRDYYQRNFDPALLAAKLTHRFTELTRGRAVP